MLNSRFKGFWLVSSYVRHEQEMFIMEEYDAKIYILCFWNVTIIYIPWEKMNLMVLQIMKNGDNKLDIFQMTTNNKELAKELVTRKFLDSKRFHVNVKDIKNPLLWWEKHHYRFPIIGLLARQILGIIGFQIETKCIFELVRIAYFENHQISVFWNFWKPRWLLKNKNLKFKKNQGSSFNPFKEPKLTIFTKN